MLAFTNIKKTKISFCIKIILFSTLNIQRCPTKTGYLEIAVSVAMGNWLKYILFHLLKELFPNQKKCSEKLIWKLCSVTLIRPGEK